MTLLARAWQRGPEYVAKEPVWWWVFSEDLMHEKNSKLRKSVGS